MTQSDRPRKINKNLFFGKLRMSGLTLEILGKQLSPPVGKSRVCQIINNAAPDYRLKEIVVILKTNVPTLFPKE